MSALTILIATGLYIGLLFLVAAYGDRRASKAGPISRPIVYTLALAVYCSSWTFYGAVGTAADSGWDYLPIYLGPALVFLFAPGFIARIGNIVRRERLTSLSDFLSARYGRSRGVGAIATIAAVTGALPYISLQLRSIGMSFEALVYAEAGAVAQQPSTPTIFAIAMALALFAILFGARQSDTTRHNAGLVLALAFEAIVKLVALGAVCWLSYALIGADHLVRNDLPEQFATSTLSGRFITITILSMAAIICLPRQFHVMAIERNGEQEVAAARWLFPAYLAITSVVVVPITLAGLTVLPDTVPADLYVLSLPLSHGQDGLALLAFLGGFSAATGMVIVSTIAVSTMVTNDLIVPLLIRSGRISDISQNGGATLLTIRRSVIIGLLVLAFGYFALSRNEALLSQIGLLSFAAAAQFAPLLIGGLYWRRAHRSGAKAGLLVGMALWTYTLLLPALIGADHAVFAWLPAVLAPQSLLGISFGDSLTHGVFWSLSANTALFIFASLRGREALRDRIQSMAFSEGGRGTVSGAQTPHVSPLTVSPEGLKALACRFLSEEAVMTAFQDLAGDAKLEVTGDRPADWRLIQLTEKLLAGALGASSARIVMMSVVGQDDVAIDDLLSILDQKTQADLFDRHMLQSMLENVSQGISVVDGDQKLVAWNSAYINLFSYPGHMVRVGTPVEELIRHNIDRGWIRDDRPDDYVQRRIDHMKVGTAYRYERPMEGGRYLRIIGNPMPGGGFVTTFTDITEDKQREQELIDINATLEERVRSRTVELEHMAQDLRVAKTDADDANASKTRFLSAASHDLLQPLNAARLYLAAAADAPDNQADLLDKVDRSIDSADQLLRGLLDISRLDHAKVTPKLEPVALGPLLHDLSEEAAPMARDAGLELRSVPTSLVVMADREFLRSIVRNFLSNARRYTEQGGILVGVRRQGDNCRIDVLDTGPGLSQSDSERAFGEFERLHDQDNQGVRGAGLGLAVAKRMATLMNASIGVNSQPGCGSCFSVTLARAMDAPAVPSSLTGVSTTPTMRNQGISAQATKVLCVDDEVEILSAMTALLQGWGAHVETASSVSQAKGALGATGFDIVLLDWQLSGGETAADILAWLADNPSPPLVAFLTANRSQGLSDAAAKWGAPILPKPVDPDLLRDLLDDVCGG